MKHFFSQPNTTVVLNCGNFINATLGTNKQIAQKKLQEKYMEASMLVDQVKMLLTILTFPRPKESMVDSSSSPEPVKGTMCCLRFNFN